MQPVGQSFVEQELLSTSRTSFVKSHFRNISNRVEILPEKSIRSENEGEGTEPGESIGELKGTLGHHRPEFTPLQIAQ
jgi:hypothetical protein